MRKRYYKRFARLILVCVGVFCFFSCEFKEIADAEYTAPTIYIPVAVNGIYVLKDTIATGSRNIRYQIDIPNKKFIVPMSVYRSGINNKGSLNIDISVNNDTINKLIAEGNLVDSNGRNLELIPSDKYTLTPSVVIENGEEWKSIILEVDLNYISTKANKRLALAVTVKSPQIETSPKLGTAIIEIDTRFLVPTPNFSYTISRTNDKIIIFTNTSSYALTYQWNMGDGSTSNQKTPNPHTYANYAIYPVSLTVTGITGIPVTITRNIQIWENISTIYLKNPGNPDPFVRSDNRTSRTGNLADWITTDNLKALSSGILYGGFYNDATFGNVMNFYNRESISNGKIYQTTNLPQGRYRVTFDPVKFDGTNNMYFVVCSGNTMPDIEQIEGNSNIFVAFNWKESIEFQEFEVTIPTDQEVTIGFVVSTPPPATGQINEVFIKSVGIYK